MSIFIMKFAVLCHLLFWIVVFESESIHAKILSLGPVQLLRRKHSFSWEASVDRATGIASSKETSSRRLREEEKEFPAKKIFHSYPKWLCRFPVSFGMLRSVRTSRGDCRIQDRIFGRDLLIFGPAKSRLLSIEFHEGVVHNTYAIELPITGGLLSIPAPRAALIFTLFTTHGQEGSRTSSIVTRISGYRPLLIGKPTPTVSSIRSVFYLSTQSLIHAGVMWRFHRYCWSNRRRT